MKKTLLQINCSSKGSTGTIMRALSETAEKNGMASYMICAKDSWDASLGDNFFGIGNPIEQGAQRKFNKFAGRYGKGFPLATRELLTYLDRIQPDIIHLHNLHHQFFDMETLFRYLKEHKVKIVWTLHDCWALTGHCAHYDAAGCEEWKTGCRKCEHLDAYPVIYRDTAGQLYSQKKAMLGDGLDLHIVTPSEWLARQVEQSYLSHYPVKVIHNGIDLNVFKPTMGTFREKYGLQGKKILLGVAFEWGPKKGLDVFL